MKIKVLLVDDEKEFVDTLAERLEVRDFVVTRAYNSDEAFKGIAQTEVDVVILDVLMPGKDGIETLLDIKKSKPLIEVIMLTGNATVETAIEGMKRGAYDYLRKPIDTKELIEKIVLAYKRKIGQEDRIRQAHIENIMLRRG